MDNNNGSGIVIGGLAGFGLAWLIPTKTHLFRPPYMREGKHLTDSELVNRYRNWAKAGRLDPRALPVIENMVDTGVPQDSIHAYARTMIMVQDCRWRGELE